MGNVAMPIDDPQVLCAASASVGVQVLVLPHRRALAHDDHGTQHFVDTLAV